MSVWPSLSTETNKIIDEISLIFNRIHVLGTSLFSTPVSVEGTKYRNKKKKKANDLCGGHYRFFLTRALKLNYLLDNTVITTEKTPWHLNSISYKSFSRRLLQKYITLLYTLTISKFNQWKRMSVFRKELPHHELPI